MHIDDNIALAVSCRIPGLVKVEVVVLLVSLLPATGNYIFISSGITYHKVRILNLANALFIAFQGGLKLHSIMPMTILLETKRKQVPVQKQRQKFCTEYSVRGGALSTEYLSMIAINE